MDAVALINARCSACHAPEAALQFHAASANQASALIDKMVQRGAKVSNTEKQTLTDFFTR